MTIQSVRELENTRQKLKGLEEEYVSAQARLAPGTPLREWTLRSLKKVIRQLTEEVIRFETRVASADQSS